MKIDKYNKRDTRIAPWAALCVLSLLAAMVFAVPSVVFAQITGQVSQECDFALLSNTHTITATVTEGGAPFTGASVFFWSEEPFGVYFGMADFDENGIATFDYEAKSVDPVLITLYTVDSDTNWISLDDITTTWTDNEADLCSESKSAGVTVGGRFTLNPKKKGALKIAVCATDGLDVSNVDPKTVRLAGVAPWHWKQKDSRLCPGGKDAVVDLVLKFKNREVVEALEESKVELADGDPVDLALTGSLDDGTTFEGVWKAEIKKKGKRHGKKKHHQKKDKKVKKDKGSKK